jgi:hypothetical protein
LTLGLTAVACLLGGAVAGATVGGLYGTTTALLTGGDPESAALGGMIGGFFGVAGAGPPPHPGRGTGPPPLASLAIRASAQRSPRSTGRVGSTAVVGHDRSPPMRRNSSSAACRPNSLVS